MTDVWVTAVLAVIAVGMVGTTGVLIKWAALARSQLRAVVVVFLLAMMGAMLVGAAIYLVHPDAIGLIEGFWVASLLMSASALIVFVEFLRETRPAPPGEAAAPLAAIRRPRTFGALVIGIVIANELLMGWTFQRANGGTIWLGHGGIPMLLEQLFVSPWFVFPMALEMGITLAMLSSEFPPHVRWLLAVQPVMMVASPPTLPGVDWVVGAAAVASLAMASAVAYLLRLVYRGEQLDRALLSYSSRLLAALGVMTAGLAWWAVGGELTVFAIGVLAQMVVFLQAIVFPSQFATGVSDPRRRDVSLERIPATSGP